MKNELSQKSIIEALKAEKGFLNREFEVLNIGLFGSYARGEHTLDSDIDFLVKLKEPSFDKLSGLLIYLEQKFGNRIELIRKSSKNMSPFVKKIEKDVIYA